MTDQIMAEGNAVIGELEVYGMNLTDENAKLRKENERLAERSDYWRKAWQDAKAREEKLATSVKMLMKESAEFKSLWRDHLDETDPEDDDDAEAKARQILWNAGDTEKKIETEGYSKSEVEYVPF